MDPGSIWIGVYAHPSLPARASEILAIRAGVTPPCLVYAGYPAEEKAPHTQYDERRVHRQPCEPCKRGAKIENAKHRLAE